MCTFHLTNAIQFTLFSIRGLLWFADKRKLKAMNTYAKLNKHNDRFVFMAFPFHSLHCLFVCTTKLSEWMEGKKDIFKNDVLLRDQYKQQ